VRARSEAGGSGPFVTFNVICDSTRRNQTFYFVGVVIEGQPERRYIARPAATGLGLQRIASAQQVLRLPNRVEANHDFCGTDFL
jgi:hypothetical protein